GRARRSWSALGHDAPYPVGLAPTLKGGPGPAGVRRAYRSISAVRDEPAVILYYRAARPLHDRRSSKPACRSARSVQPGTGPGPRGTTGGLTGANRSVSPAKPLGPGSGSVGVLLIPVQQTGPDARGPDGG